MFLETLLTFQTSFLLHFSLPTPPEYKLKEYRTVIKNRSQRKTFTKFRISNHKPMMEYGRYQKMPHEQRLCQFCSSSKVEDEYYFILSGQTYNMLRFKFIFDLKNTFSMPTNPYLVTTFSKFVVCFLERGNALKIGKSIANFISTNTKLHSLP